MRAFVLHDETGRIVAAAATEGDMDLQMLPGSGEFVLEVDGEDLELANVTALTQENAERVRASLTRVQGSLRVDVAERARMSSRRLVKA